MFCWIIRGVVAQHLPIPSARDRLLIWVSCQDKEYEKGVKKRRVACGQIKRQAPVGR